MSCLIWISCCLCSSCCLSSCCRVCSTCCLCSSSSSPEVAGVIGLLSPPPYPVLKLRTEPDLLNWLPPSSSDLETVRIKFLPALLISSTASLTSRGTRLFIFSTLSFGFRPARAELPPGTTLATYVPVSSSGNLSRPLYMRESPNPLFPLSTRMFCCLILSFVFTFGFVHTNFSVTLVALFGFHNLRTVSSCQTDPFLVIIMTHFSSNTLSRT